jgi:hypothetical protein
MILGIQITGPMMVAGGTTLLLLVLFQLASGMRWIKFGKQHFKVHRYVGIGIVVVALFHALLGVTFALGLTIL